MKAYEIALELHGIKEVLGEQDNPKITNFFKILGYDFKDEIAWCSAFMNYCQKIGGNDYTGKLNAKSWLKWGNKTVNPKLGDVVIFHRGNPQSWKGHVGFFICERNGKIHTLGGNQSNQVKISEYAKSRVAGYRTAF